MYEIPAESVYSGVKNAGNNVSLFQTQYAMGLVKRLDTYERVWIDLESTGNLSESSLHQSAMNTSGLTQEGLCTARGYAGKKASWKPGIFELREVASNRA